MHFLDKQEEADFVATVTKLKGLVKEPHAALHYLAVSAFETNRIIGKIQQMIDKFHGDDPWPLVGRIEDELRELDGHICGTDIGMADEFNAWLTKDGWKPRSEMPFLQD